MKRVNSLGGGRSALSDAEYALQQEEQIVREHQEYVRILKDAVKKDKTLSLKKQQRVTNIFKRLLTFFSFIDPKSEKCFCDFYDLHQEVRR